MMGRPLHSRTEGSGQLRPAWLLGPAQEPYEAKVCALAFLSNRYYLLALETETFAWHLRLRRLRCSDRLAAVGRWSSAEDGQVLGLLPFLRTSL